MPASPELGQQKVGIPHAEAINAVVDKTSSQNWADFNPAIAMYYLDSMLANHLLSFIQNSLSEDELSSLDPNKVRLTTLVLWRDHFRHNAKHLRPNAQSDEWIDEVFSGILDDMGINESDYGDFSTKFELNEVQVRWATELSAPLNLKAHLLAITHSAIVTGVEEELVPQLAKASKPWWKFW